MVFWGVEVRPGKRYCHNFDPSRGRLRISQATLGDGKSESKSSILCNVGNSSPVSLCTLIPNVSETCHLELEFEEDEEVSFSILGPRSIHLSGYYPGHIHRLDGDDTESYGEDIAVSDSSDSFTGGSEDEYESDFIDDDDDVGVYADLPMHKSNVVIEEIEDDEKPCDRNRKLRRLKKEHGISDAEDVETESKQVALRNNEPTEEESEDEDGFPICFSSMSKSLKKKICSNKKSKPDHISQDIVSVSDAMKNHDSKIPAETASMYDEKPKKKKRKDDKHSVGSENDERQNKQNETRKVEGKSEKDERQTKQNGSAKVEDKSEINYNISVEEIERNSKSSLNGAKYTDNSVISSENDTCKTSKKKTKRKRAIEEAISDVKVPDKDTINTDKPPQDDNLPIDKKKKTKKNKKMNTDAGINHEVSEKEKSDVMDGIDDSQHISQSIKTRTFPNGLVVEEVSMGKPEGKKASPGKKVSVRYIGKLNNGKIFDSNIGQSPFKFRLGIGEVIKGWDIGVSGMRVGDKRRLTIPPSFGYGAKGAGKIPPNSWLVFDVELVDVQ